MFSTFGFGRFGLCCVTIALLAGCGSKQVPISIASPAPTATPPAPAPSPTATPPPPVPSPTATNGLACATTPTGRLYVVNDTGNLVAYTLPLTSASTPIVLQSGSQDVGISFDPSGNLYLSQYYNSVSLIPAPYTGAATHTLGGASVGGGNPVGTLTDASGHFFVAEGAGNVVYEFSSFTGALLTTVSGFSHPQAIAMDKSGNLFVGDDNAIRVFAPPYTGAATKTIGNGGGGLAFDARGNLFIAKFGASSVTVYAPPYAATNVIATVTSGVANPIGIAVDSACNLYVPNYGGDTIEAFAPPYTGAPFATLSGNLPDSAAIGP